MRFTTSLLTLLFLLPLAALAQPFSISGYVYDYNNPNQVVAGKTVTLTIDSTALPPRGWSYTTTSNANGYYTTGQAFPGTAQDSFWVTISTTCPQPGGGTISLDTMVIFSGQSISLANLFTCDTNVTPPPSCNASYTYRAAALGQQLVFDASASTGSGLSYAWYSNGQNIGNGTPFTYTFPGANPGDSVEVMLVINSPSGCSDTLVQFVTIPGSNPQPTTGTINAYIYHQNINWSQGVSGTTYLVEYSVRQSPAGLDTILSLVDSANYAVADSGWVSFQNVPFGDYLVKSQIDPNTPQGANFLPTYADSALYWHSAKVLTLDTANSNLSQMIVLVPGQNPGGPGFIGGSVSNGANKTSNTAGITVILRSDDGSVVQYAVTDANGNYEFSNLPYGTYTLTFDWLNETGQEREITLSAANPSENQVELLTVDAVSSLPEALQGLQVGALYPNPGALVNLEVNLQQAADLRFSVLNLRGQVMYSQDFEATVGANTLSADLSDLAAGIYLTKLEGEGVIIDSQRFVKQ